MLLESAGHEVLLADSPPEVLKLLDGTPPDVLIVDLRFPTYEQGIGLLQNIRATGCDKSNARPRIHSARNLLGVIVSAPLFAKTVPRCVQARG